MKSFYDPIEPPIRNLEQLEHAMKFKNYQLLVEQESSSYGILEVFIKLFIAFFVSTVFKKIIFLSI